MRDLGNLRCFLGIWIMRTEQTMHLSQAAYVESFLKKLGMSDCQQDTNGAESTLDIRG
jgi:hypothetical protein